VTWVAAATIGIGVANLTVAAPAQAGPYGSCAQARAAGAAPLYAGQPGYSSDLDRDGDGVACESGSSGGGYVPAPLVPAPIPPAAAPAPSATPAPAPARVAPTETCDDWGKLRPNPAGGEEQVCGAISSPATVWYWIPAGPMPGGVHDAGSTCPDVTLFTFGRTPNDYQVWCAEGTSVGLPGGGAVTNPPIPIWGLYSP
jgi:hypothetical protein